ncbi:E3 ubiquitin-protein ligase RSL1-like [Andrographis paniculata]|uniref:E3 ubiquitin-protein ligase RSL1-like n=1 Tax=Andrographis paniculata TaxID=175694 RepID=UPI0021E845E0|nr:E3 ubiquitin-protein ligase RSL1-like [Andrographis paniculata]
MAAPTVSLASDDLPVVAAEQRRELTTAMNLNSDLDVAFDLQLQEAINASLALHPQASTSSAALPPPLPSSSSSDDKFPTFMDQFSEELTKLEQELKDEKVSEMEFKKLKDDLNLRMHDLRFAQEISSMPEEEWEDWGDDFERPFGEGSSKGGQSEIFRVYFKGLVEAAAPPKLNSLGGIGVAVCDSRDALLFELRKPLVGCGQSRQAAELRALTEALTCALDLELKRIAFYCDYYPVYKFVTRQWASKQKKISELVRQVCQLKEKFSYCQPVLVARNDIKYAFKLARDAIVSQVSKATAESSSSRDSFEKCVICLEDTNVSQIFVVDNCDHRYCYSCMKQHVEVKLLHGLLPKCPHEECQNELKIDSCNKFLTPKLIEIMSQRIKEASIPVTEKIYCPYPKCSALTSKTEALEHSKKVIVGAERSGARICKKCNGRFCANCKAPWHNNMTCADFKKGNHYSQVEEAKLIKLAVTNLWRQCSKCNHMIELVAGCYHMTCRCGYEFCYTCGAEWKEKGATCSCDLWDENYIMDDEFDEDDYEDDSDLDSDDYDHMI